MPLIKNLDALGTSTMRRQALDIVEAGISAVLPARIMNSALTFNQNSRTITVNGNDYPVPGGRLFVIGGGKAAGLMAQALEEIIPPENITAGTVNCKGGRFKTGKVRVKTAGHPIPDNRGIEGVRGMLDLKHRFSINERDLVLCLISGGGSALMPYPAEGINLTDKQEITRLLISSGAEISEINAVRKHLSRIKGGQLGCYFAPATVVSLILSDVIGNDMAVIASGPTYPDTSTYSDACRVLERYKLIDRAPGSIINLLREGDAGKAAETPKFLDNCYNHIIGDNGLALEAMRARAGQIGLKAVIVTSRQKGDAAAVARDRAAEVTGGKYSGFNAVLIGGETTVTLPASPGRGGRNQHYAAVSLLAMEPYSGEWVVASVGTDGSDFLPDTAGGIVDRESLKFYKDRGVNVISYLERCDSNGLLGQTGNSLVVTGDTGTNVGDVIVYILGN
ncbi:MAG: DUF4147 domain-containing protein [Dehalococcoidia bacterium]|nr:DUF4147 domain-containing protein [Dehalococcoidia bacterium]